MAQLVRATYSRSAAIGGPDKPGHDGLRKPPDSLILERRLTTLQLHVAAAGSGGQQNIRVLRSPVSAGEAFLRDSILRPHRLVMPTEARLTVEATAPMGHSQCLLVLDL
jgi:hypothetical protein